MWGEYNVLKGAEGRARPTQGTEERRDRATGLLSDHCKSSEGVRGEYKVLKGAEGRARPTQGTEERRDRATGLL